MSISSRQILPQEWPQPFSAEAAVHSVNIATPIGEPLLDFSQMNAPTFEQFCWWLLKKDQTLIGCKRLGRSGTEQHGIDIFACDEQQPEKLSVFECKAWKDFSSSNLTEAIDAFLDGSWARLTRRFTLILAQKDIGHAMAKRWIKEAERLKRVGIEAELWNAHTLTLKVQIYPDVLTKFFPWASVEHHANLWMQRVGFYELVSKTFFDPRKRVRNWARELATQVGMEGVPNPRSHVGSAAMGVARPVKAQPDSESTQNRPLVIDGELRTVHRGENYWNFKGPWFSLSAILPTGRFTQSSAAITLNKENMSGLTLTFDHKWLLRSFLSQAEAPLKDIYRGFIVGSMPHDPNSYLIDFPHCRFFLEEECVREIAWVADMLAAAMRDALLSMEAHWSAQNFPLVEWAGKKVAIAAISVDLWNEIGRFAEENDVSNGTTYWHMFDGSSHALKPCHERPTEHFDAGYHGVFYATEIEGLSFKDEVVLLWQSNELQSSQKLSPRSWWPCDFALQWLIETLLPEIKRRVCMRNFGSPWRKVLRHERARDFSASMGERFTVRDLRQPTLTRHGQRSAGPLQSAIVLQRFFHGLSKPEPYIRQHEIDGLYEAAALIAQGGKGYLEYARSKLLLHTSPGNHAELIRMIHEHIQNGRTVANSAVADNVFRAILELLGDSDEWLSASDTGVIKAAIAPFARIRDDAVLIERHTRWS